MKRALAIALLVGVVAAPASATESTIVPGVGIGKIKLGMTQAQVERVLGKDYLVNDEGIVGDARYRELAWNFASWSVVFLRRGFDWRVVQVELTLNTQRTTRGIGVSSPFKQVVRSYPQVFCGGIYPSWGTQATEQSYDALILMNKSVYTAFAVKPSVFSHAESVWRVFAVMVQQAVPGHITLEQNNKTVPTPNCLPGWRQRGKP